jgi:hypothetical protein
MAPSLQLPQEAARLWGNPITRQKILAMHARGDSLLDMVDALGLTAALQADGLATAIAALTPAEVQIIRDVFVTEAKLAGDHAGASFPIDCRADAPGDRVHVTSSSQGGAAPVARIDNP